MRQPIQRATRREAAVTEHGRGNANVPHCTAPHRIALRRAVIETRRGLLAGAREFHARDIKDLNGRPLITSRALAMPRETAQSGSRAFVFGNSSPTHRSPEELRPDRKKGAGGGGGGVERVYCMYLGNMVSRYRTFEFPEQSLL